MPCFALFIFTSCHRYGLCAATSFLWYRKFVWKIPLWGEGLISALLYSQDCSLINPKELSLRAWDFPADAGSSLEALNFRISDGCWHACLHQLSGHVQNAFFYCWTVWSQATKPFLLHCYIFYIQCKQMRARDFINQNFSHCSHSWSQDTAVLSG